MGRLTGCSDELSALHGKRAFESYLSGRARAFHLPRVRVPEPVVGMLHLPTLLDALPKDTGEHLHGVEPHAWLPFITDENLRTWRDFIAEQLPPGGNSRTVEVFAQRLGMSNDEFADLLNSEERLEELVFSNLPRQVLVEYQEKLVTENIHLLETYLKTLAY